MVTVNQEKSSREAEAPSNASPPPGPAERKVAQSSARLLDRPSGVFWVVVWLGLAAGIGGVVARLVYPPPMRDPLWSPWLATPVVELGLFLVGAAVVSLLSRPRATTRWRVPAVLGFAWLASTGPLLQVPWLHRYAALVVAVGLAAQFVALVRRYPGGARWLMARSGALMAVGVVVLALAPPTARWWHERRVRGATAAANPDRPNVLLITLCSVRAESLSCYGYGRPTTPELTKFAKTGVLFERALSTAPWTFPSHAGILTGRLPHELTADYFVPLDKTHPTLAEVFQARGYATAGFVANYLYCGVATHLDRGFMHYNDRPPWPREGLRMSSLGQIITGFDLPKQLIGGFNDVMPSKAGLTRKSAGQLNEEFLQWLQSHSGRPFFAFLNYYDAHEPYVPPAPFNQKFRDVASSPRRPAARTESLGGMPWKPLASWQGDVEDKLLRYEQCVAYIDDQLGVLFDELGRRGVLQNTLVIIAGDHGEQFGEHGLESHGNSLYRQLIQVPLVISFPARLPQGVTVGAPVSLRDIPATILAQLDVPDASAFPGQSLLRFVDLGPRGSAPASQVVVSANNVNVSTQPQQRATKGTQESIVAGGWHYIVDYGRGSQELYDFDRDPLEEANLIDTQRGRSGLDELQTVLKAVQQASGGQTAALDASTVRF